MRIFYVCRIRLVITKLAWDYCKGVIKSIDNRGWDIRNATDWKKFENRDGVMIWGYHTLFDCKSGDIYKISSEGNISLFVCDLIFEIDMKSYGPYR